MYLKQHTIHINVGMVILILFLWMARAVDPSVACISIRENVVYSIGY